MTGDDYVQWLRSDDGVTTCLRLAETQRDPDEEFDQSYWYKVAGQMLRAFLAPDLPEGTTHE